jgi:hypothetical protein
MKTRYKVTKEQLEMVVESFVTENKKETINEADPVAVGSLISGVIAAAGGMATLEGYIDELEKKNPNHKLVKMMKALRDAGSAAGKARRGESVEPINEVDPVAVGGLISGVIAAAGGMAALEGYIDELEKKNPNHKLVKMMKALRDAGSAAGQAKRG